MATNLEDTKLFQEQKAKDKLIIRGMPIQLKSSLVASNKSNADLPKFDLESYISNYDGKRFDPDT